MTPEYTKNYIDKENADIIFNELLKIDWLKMTEARREYFMSDDKLEYTYSNRTYVSKPYHKEVKLILNYLNGKAFDYNVCFLNRYDSYKNQLGYHQDDSSEIDHNHPIAVVSLGQPRELWWKHQSQKGDIPDEQKVLLEHGSLFIMPRNFQQEYWHKIPKHNSQNCGTRISLTFRKYKYE